MRRKKSLFLGLASCLLLAACDSSTLFSPPARGGSNAPLPPVADSFVTLVANLPYSVLGRIAEQKMPRTFPIGGDGQVACINVPHVNPGHVGSHQECLLGVCADVPDFVAPSIGTTSQCADYHWHADVNKEGSTQISRDANSLRLSQGIHIVGQAGVGGDLAGMLSLHGKNIGIRATPRVILSATLDKQWCPAIIAAPVGAWVDQAEVEVVGRNCVEIDLGALGHPEICAGPVDLGIANELNREFDKHREDLQKTAETAIPCESVRPKIENQWHPLAIKVERDKLPPLYLNIQPKSAAFSGVMPDDDRLRVAVRIGAQTILAAKPIDTAVRALPPLDPLSADRGNLQINLQVVASYEMLKQQLHQSLANQTFQKEVPTGKVEVRILDVDVYPSKDSLALGLKIDAKTPGSWFNTSGWIYLSGKPAVANGKIINVENIRFTAVIDNTFWSTVAVLFENEILQAINNHSTFDLSKEIAKAADEITKAIATADVPGLKIKAGTPNLSLDGVYVTDTDLVAVARLAMSVEAEVTDAILN